MSPFDLVKDLLNTKANLMAQDPSAEKAYVPFIVNKALSYHYDCLSFSQEMNTRYHLDHRMQYDYFFHVIRKKYRPFQKWVKPEVHTTLTVIQEVFGYSPQRAQEAMVLLTPDQMLRLMQLVDKGGLSKTPKQ